MQRRILLTSALAAALAPLLAACGDDKSGGTLRIEAPLPDALDPAALQSDLDAQLAAHVYSGLVTLNDKGEPIPDLAQRWSLSPDGRDYRFPLRPGLRFHNGEELTAGHVKRTWERILHPAEEAPRALAFLGKVNGVAAYRSGLSGQISGVRALDERTLDVQLTEPDLTLPAKLSHPTTHVQPTAANQGADAPVGSGPFAVTDWAPGALLSLERNAHYHGFAPLLDRVRITGGPDADSLSRYARDELDVLYVGANDIPAVLDRNNPLHKDLRVHDGLDIAFLAMNNRMPPFDDRGVRLAFALAIDRAAIVEQVFALTVAKATALLPPSLAQGGDTAASDFDISKARQALADSRYRDVSNLPEITFTVPGTRGPPPSTVVALVNMFQQHLGVRIAIRREPWDRFVDQLHKRENPYQVFLFTWHADYPDPRAVLDPLFYSLSTRNYSGYADPDVDELLFQARGERDAGRRRETLAAVAQRVAADAPVTPLWHGKSYLLLKPWVRDAQLAATARPWLNRVYRDD